MALAMCALLPRRASREKFRSLQDQRQIGGLQGATNKSPAPSAKSGAGKAAAGKAAAGRAHRRNRPPAIVPSKPLARAPPPSRPRARRAPKHAAAPKQPAGKKAAAPGAANPPPWRRRHAKANAAGKGGKGGKNDKPNKPGRGRAAVAAASSAAMPPPASSVRAEAAALRSSTAYVQDLETSTVLFAKNENVVRPIASISKLMTAVVVVDANQPMNEMLEITDDDIDGLKHTTSRLRVGTS